MLIYPPKHAKATPRTKVLVLADAFLPRAGGSREYYNNVYRNLVDLGDSEVTVITKKVPGWQEFDRVTSTEFYRIERGFRPLPSWKLQQLPKGLGPFIQTLIRVLRGWPDIIHSGDLYPQGVTALILKKTLGIPYVVYCHGEEIPQLDRFRYQPRVRDQIYKHANAVIAASEFTRQNLLRLGISENRIHKVTPGVNAMHSATGAAQALKTKYELTGKIVVLTVARLVPRKGHRLALQAFAEVCRDIPTAHYLIVGTGPDEQALRQLVQQAGIQRQVTFTGYIESELLPDIYNLADLVMMPNRQETDGDVEGFGIVFLEAGSAGKPVIGGRSGGAVEAIVDGVTGYLVDPNDPFELTQMLRRLLSDEALRTRMGAAGKAWVESEFNWKTRAETLRRINNTILGRDRSAGSAGAHMRADHILQVDSHANRRGCP